MEVVEGGGCMEETRQKIYASKKTKPQMQLQNLPA